MSNTHTRERMAPLVIKAIEAWARDDLPLAANCFFTLALYYELWAERLDPQSGQLG